MNALELQYDDPEAATPADMEIYEAIAERYWADRTIDEQAREIERLEERVRLLEQALAEARMHRELHRPMPGMLWPTFPPIPYNPAVTFGSGAGDPPLKPTITCGNTHNEDGQLRCGNLS